VKVLRVAIDATLAPYRPEITWILQTLFAGLGYAWSEVQFGEPCDLAYGTAPPPAARCFWPASPERWRARHDRGLEDVVETEGRLRFRFHGEPADSGGAHDELFDAFWLASGLAERRWPRNRFGFFRIEGSRLHAAGVFRKAPVSALAHRLQRVLEPQVGPPGFPRWPGGARAAACAGHDVDYPEVKRLVEPLRALRRLGGRGAAPAVELLLGRRHHWHFDGWTRTERELGMRSAFYFVARPGSLLEYALGRPDPFYDVGDARYRRLLSSLAGSGFEVGMQASYEAYRDQAVFRAEKAKVEEVLGAAVFGNRHHYWHLNPADAEDTLLIHEAAGLLYDSSLAFEQTIGWRRGLTWPFFPYSHRLRRPIRTLQLQTAWMDDQLFGYAAHNGSGSRQALIGELVETARAQGGLLLADMHEYVFDPVLFPGWAKTWFELFGGLAADTDFHLARPVDLARHWTTRADAIAKASLGLAAA
jgi:hypothetical protein